MLSPCPGLQVVAGPLDSHLLDILHVGLVVPVVHLGHEGHDPGSSGDRVNWQLALEEVPLNLLVVLIPGRRKEGGKREGGEGEGEREEEREREERGRERGRRKERIGEE